MSWMVLAVLICMPAETMAYSHWLAFATLPFRVGALVAMLVALRLGRLDPVTAGRLFLAQATLTILGWSFFIESSPDKVAFEAVGYGTILPVLTLLIAPRPTRRAWSLVALVIAVAPSIAKLVPDHPDLLAQIGAVLLVHATAVAVLDIHAGRAEQDRAIALLDPLTGLLNRRPGLALIDDCLAELTGDPASGGKASMVLLDIDHFKAVNDAFGHEAGDEILTRVAAVLVDSAPATATVCRWGGEEFLVLLPGLDENEARTIAARTRRAITATGVTASFGVAQLAPDDTSTRWIRRADEALYAAKADGRDRVVVASGIAGVHSVETEPMRSVRASP